MYSQQHIKQLILNFEKKYPVDTWNINGVDIWPYVRIKIYIHMLVLMNNQTLGTSSVNKQKTEKSNNTIRLIRKIIYLLLGQFQLSIFFLNLKPKKIIFFGSHIHRVIQDGYFFNRFYDSMIDYHGILNDVYIVEYQKIQEPIYNQKAIISLNKYLFHYKIKSKFFRIFLANENPVQLRGYINFYNDLIKMDLGLSSLSLDEKNLIKWVNKLKLSEGYFKKLYEKVRPSKVIFLGYYGLDDICAALFVANKLKIKTIDFQHGPQTNVHLAYANWSKVPVNGFNTMPIEFWNWDMESKKNIDNWSSKTKTIKAKVVGQPYLGYWINNISKVKNIKKEFILYSLQTHPFTIETMITPKIISLIKFFGFNWVFRLHPRSNLDLNELNIFLKLNKIENKVDVQDAFNTPLPEVLTKSILHITNYSGCLIEALQLGTASLLINEVGKEMFSQYIDDNLVYYIDQNDQSFFEKSKALINGLKVSSFELGKSKLHNPLN